MDRIVSPNHYGIPPNTHRKFHQNQRNRLGGVCSQAHAQKKYIYNKDISNITARKIIFMRTATGYTY
jgi:hypothetical protein